MYIFDISFFGLHIAPTWYGLSYAAGFIVCYLFIRKKFEFRISSHIDTLLSYVFFGVILGGRLGYVLLYNLNYYIDNPLKILTIWEGGMSFHGGFLGTVITIYVFSRKYNYSFWKLIDTLAVIIPVAIGLGRIGNWINSELPGYTPYNGPFPMILNGTYHFPSPLLEMMLEGMLLGIGMYTLYKTQKERKPGFLSGSFLIGYSIARIIAEQFRLPDAHIGYILGSGWLTLGIIYTIPMIVYGLYLVIKNR